MARVTVEDCVRLVPNRFDLVLLAAQRSREISSGAPLTVDRDNDKNPVIALREIADKTVDLQDLDSTLLQSYQRVPELDEPDEELADVLADQIGEGEQPQQAAETASEELSESVDSITSELDAVFGVQVKGEGEE